MIVTATIGTGAMAAVSGNLAVVGMAATGSCIAATVIALLFRRRAVARIRRKFEEVFTGGFVLGALTAYQKGVFASSTDDVPTTEELADLRDGAYQAAADEHLPHPVRHAAAAVLEAIDARDAPHTQLAMGQLSKVVRKELRAVWKTDA